VCVGGIHRRKRKNLKPEVKTERERKMTFRTLDIDTASESPDAAMAMSSAPARNSRSRRHGAVMSHRNIGSRVVGFGF
tara:strand:- start:257 stop:490 length:234 start_codon:yes stop_codon:yes gene_type:complete